MEAFQTDSGFLYRFVRAECEGKTMNYVLREMKEVLGEEQPDPEQVRAYLQAPDKPTTLSFYQRMVAIDKLLECVEVNFRMTCDLIRYQWI